MTVSVDRLDGVYILDASAVLPLALRDLLAVSMDYDRYAQMGIPHLRECRVLSATPEPGLLYTWSAMSYFGQSSKHHLLWAPTCRPSTHSHPPAVILEGHNRPFSNASGFGIPLALPDWW